MLRGIERGGIGDGHRRLRRGGQARRHRDERLRLPRHAHALTVALELDLAQPGLVEQARKLAPDLRIDRKLLLTLVLAFAGHEPSTCRAPGSVRPTRRWRARSR